MPIEVELKSPTEAIRRDAIDACGAGRVVPLSEAYRPPGGVYDEMFAASGGVRPHYLGSARMLLSMTPEQLAAMRSAAERKPRNEGVTFNVYSEQAGVERIFPFDVMLRIIDHATWSRLEAGLIQRVKALNTFVADVYHEGQILKDGLVPRDLILESAQYRRGTVGLTPPRTFTSRLPESIWRGAPLVHALRKNVSIRARLAVRRDYADVPPQMLLRQV